MIHLRSVAVRPGATGDGFPFSVPAVRALGTLEFDAPVTFLVGENGSGKSTVLEVLAIATRRIAVGSDDLRSDATLAAQERFARHLKPVWNRWTDRGFFLRAEDFFGFAKRLGALRAELQAHLEEVGQEYGSGSSYARSLAEGPLRSSLAEMEQRYGRDLDARSHGEAFLQLFRSRFIPGGLYLLDEPEAALSPQSQLALIAMLHGMVARDAQFLIATHSPILLAFPGAGIVSFDRHPVERVEYAELEHVNLTRDFLNAPERFLRPLLADE